jgi:hypothetical protein
VERDHCVASRARGDPFSHSGTYHWIVGFHPPGCGRRWGTGTGGRRWRRDQRVRLAGRASRIRASEIGSDGDAEGDPGHRSTSEAARAKATRGITRDSRATSGDGSCDDPDNRCRNWQRWNRRRGSWNWWRSRIGGRSWSREQHWPRHGRGTRKRLSAHGERLVHTTDASAIRREGLSHEGILRC